MCLSNSNLNVTRIPANARYVFWLHARRCIYSCVVLHVSKLMLPSVAAGRNGAQHAQHASLTAIRCAHHHPQYSVAFRTLHVTVCSITVP
jgi:hypothetical protein